MGNPQSKDNIIVSQSPTQSAAASTPLAVGMQLSEIFLLTIVVVLAGYIVLRLLRYFNARLLEEVERRAVRRAIGPAQNV